MLEDFRFVASTVLVEAVETNAETTGRPNHCDFIAKTEMLRSLYVFGHQSKGNFIVNLPQPERKFFLVRNTRYLGLLTQTILSTCVDKRFSARLTDREFVDVVANDIRRIHEWKTQMLYTTNLSSKRFMSPTGSRSVTCHIIQKRQAKSEEPKKTSLPRPPDTHELATHW